MMSSHRLIVKLKRALKDNSFPKDLEIILSSCSFDSDSSILGINNEVIKNTESYINDNKYILENTSYKDISSSKEFRFKPGHKSILLLLPKALSEYKENAKQKKKNSTQQDNIEVVEVEAEVEVEQLKEKLLQKLFDFANKNLFEIIFEKSSIRNYIHSNKPHCKFSCPLCSRSYKCYHTSYWNISNLEKHLKSHFEQAKIETIEVPVDRQIVAHSDTELDNVSE